jgi:hypothetical protein
MADVRTLEGISEDFVAARAANDAADLRSVVDAKLAITRHRKWRNGLWREHSGEIEDLWTPVLVEWIDPDQIPLFDSAVDAVARRMRQLQLDYSLDSRT